MDQHKVPRLCLKHFAGPDGFVWTYDKIRGTRWPAVPERTSVEAHYYSVELEDGSMDTGLEKLFSEIEGQTAPIYEKLATGVLPKGTDRETFGHFLGLMYVRTPSMRRLAATVHKSGFETQLAFSAQHPDTFAAMLKRLANDGIDVSNPEFIRSCILDLSNTDLLLPKSWVLRIIGKGSDFADVFLRMKWSIARAEHHYFLTCDTPIFRAIDPSTHHPIYGDLGLLNPTAEITFPVSNQRTLIMHWKSGSPWEVKLPKEWVRNENIKRAYCAEREVYAHIEHKAIAKLVAKFKDQRLQIRSSTLPGSKGFGGVEVPRRWAKRK